MTVNDIYMFLEQIAPFKYQESYDNSGFLIGDKNAAITKICVCLDITLDVIAEAKKAGANLIISHHPVIFKAVKGINAKTPVYELIRNDINAVCAHTNFDVAFMSDIMISKLGFEPSREIIEVTTPEGSGFGKIVNLPEFISADELALKCKNAFKSPVIKYINGGKFVSRVGVCPGAGGSAFGFAAEKNCHAFITGEVKHSLFVEAKNIGITLIDAGHFQTEISFCNFLKNKLCEQFPDSSVFVAESSANFCRYI